MGPSARKTISNRDSGRWLRSIRWLDVPTDYGPTRSNRVIVASWSTSAHTKLPLSKKRIYPRRGKQVGALPINAHQDRIRERHRYSGLLIAKRGSY